MPHQHLKTYDKQKKQNNKYLHSLSSVPQPSNTCAVWSKNITDNRHLSIIADRVTK